MTKEERSQRLREQLMSLCWHNFVWQTHCFICSKCGYHILDPKDEPNPDYFTMPDCWKLVEKLTSPGPTGQPEITSLKIEWFNVRYKGVSWHVTILPLEPSDEPRFPEAIAGTFPEAIIGAIERMKGWQP